MRTTRISSGGQVQVPAEVRRRWGTRNVIVEDLGDALAIRPVPDDPISAALTPPARRVNVTANEMMRQFREEERAAEERNRGRR